MRPRTLITLFAICLSLAATANANLITTMELTVQQVTVEDYDPTPTLQIMFEQFTGDPCVEEGDPGCTAISTIWQNTGPLAVGQSASITDPSFLSAATTMLHSGHYRATFSNLHDGVEGGIPGGFQSTDLFTPLLTLSPDPEPGVVFALIPRIAIVPQDHVLSYLTHIEVVQTQITHDMVGEFHRYTSTSLVHLYGLPEPHWTMLLAPALLLLNRYRCG